MMKKKTKSYQTILFFPYVFNVSGISFGNCMGKNFYDSSEER